MIQSLAELDELLQFIKSSSGWRELPPASVIRACREEALALNDDSGDLAVELAAMFFAMCRDEVRLNRGWRQLPGMFVWYCCDWLALDLNEEHVAALPDLQDEIAEGKDWPEVRQWFVERVIRR